MNGPFGRPKRIVPIARRIAVLALVVWTGLLRPAARADELPGAAPEPAPPAVARERRLSLGLERALVEPPRGHAEFDLSLRRQAWDDPMARLAFALGREESAARRGGLAGSYVPFSATTLVLTLPGADVRRVLAGPFADDWQDLSTQEKIGRAAETVVYYGVLYEILRGLAGRPR